MFDKVDSVGRRQKKKREDPAVGHSDGNLRRGHEKTRGNWWAMIDVERELAKDKSMPKLALLAVLAAAGLMCWPAFARTVCFIAQNGRRVCIDRPENYGPGAYNSFNRRPGTGYAPVPNTPSRPYNRPSY